MLFFHVFQARIKWTWNARHTRPWFDHWSRGPSSLFSRKKKDTWSQVTSTPFPVMGASSSTSTSCFMRNNIACYVDYIGAIDFTFWRHLLFLYHWPMFWHFPPEQIWIVFCSVVSVQQQEMVLVIHSYHLLTLVLLPLKIKTVVNSFTNCASLFGWVWVPCCLCAKPNWRISCDWRA